MTVDLDFLDSLWSSFLLVFYNLYSSSSRLESSYGFLGYASVCKGFPSCPYLIINSLVN